MTGDEVIAALDIPAEARVDRRVPKALLLEHGAPTAADRRRINDGIEQIHWVAALKPGTIGIAPYRDETREYLEIAVLRVGLRPGGRAERLIALVHRAVPYPVLALTERAGGVLLSLAHLRWSQAEAGRTVLDGDPLVVAAPDAGEIHLPEFAAALALGRQPRTDLRALYDGWIDLLLALEAARRTGALDLGADAHRRAGRGEALRECARLETAMARLRSAAARERQIARRVELNAELKRAEAARTAALARL